MIPVKNILFLSFLLSTNSIHGCNESTISTKLIQQFPIRLTNPTFVTFGPKQTVQNIFRLAKDVMLSKEKWSMVRVATHMEGTNGTHIGHFGPLVFLPCNNKGNYQKTITMIDRLNLGVSAPVIIITFQSFLDMETINVRLDQEVLFLDKQSWSLLEVYKVSGTVVQTLLGYFDIANMTFNKSENSKSFVQRRSNFHGLHMIGLSEHEPPESYLDPEFEQLAPFYPGNETYDITSHMTHGRYVDLTRQMSEELNFTFSIYKRKDGVWGSGDSGKLTGMLSDVYYKRADIIIGGLAMIPSRLKFVAYLFAASDNLAALFIKRDLDEKLKWTYLLEPFSWDLWVCLACVAVVFGTIFMFVNETPTKVLFLCLHFGA